MRSNVYFLDAAAKRVNDLRFVGIDDLDLRLVADEGGDADVRQRRAEFHVIGSKLPVSADAPPRQMDVRVTIDRQRRGEIRGPGHSVRNKQSVDLSPSCVIPERQEKSDVGIVFVRSPKPEMSPDISRPREISPE